VQVGDLVRYGPKMASASGRVGIVVEIHYRVVPTAVVQWNGVASAMGHRIDLLEVISENR
jgi:hypothetical protein